MQIPSVAIVLRRFIKALCWKRYRSCHRGRKQSDATMSDPDAEVEPDSGIPANAVCPHGIHPTDLSLERVGKSSTGSSDPTKDT
jgi:hypothetical protein